MHGFLRNGLMGATAAALLTLVGLATAATLHPKLKIGDPAPQLRDLEWIKGGPIARYEPGHVYVVDFWASWCVPCNQKMPHLSALQARYPQQLTVIGINARETEGTAGGVQVVSEFVKKKGDKMAYTIAMDDPVKQGAFSAWMTAAGSFGIPTAFVIDQSGMLTWVGHPLLEDEPKFDAAVEQALAGKSDLASARATQAELNRETAKRLQEMANQTTGTGASNL